MIVTKRHLSRRTVLRGAGVTLALPLLDAMVPAFAGSASAATVRPRRFVAVYCGNGMAMTQWNPAATETLTLSPILAALHNVQDQTVVLTGLHSNQVDLIQDGGIHPRCQTAWLTGALAKKADYNLRAGTSADQIAARTLGKDTQLTSLELAIESAEDSRVTARSATAVLTTTRSRGRLRKSRCRWRTIRGRSSSDCSAPATARIAPCVWPRTRRTAASSTR